MEFRGLIWSMTIFGRKLEATASKRAARGARERERNRVRCYVTWKPGYPIQLDGGVERI